MIYAAVITADLVNSTKLRPTLETQLVNTLKLELNSYETQFFRGDSFQVFVKDVHESLRVAMICRTIGIKFSDTKKDVPSDVRLSIGIGKVQSPVRSLGSAKGEAFLLSGRALDQLQHTSSRFSISINNNLVQLALNVVADYVDAIFLKMTAKQAEVLMQLLKNKSQREIAQQLKKSGSTINQRVTSARWDEIQKLLVHFDKIINAGVMASD